MNIEPGSYPMASLYVGELAEEITEAQLFEKFSAVGPVLSIRVCRDVISRKSLGYAYVNFQQPRDAERAIEEMNFTELKNKNMRIMWSQRDPSLRRSGVGNIFLKNLDKSIDNKAIYDTFSAFGTILSCKVSLDDKGNSKCYGFVHFDSEESGNSAIANVNGMLLNGKKVYVGKFIPRAERLKEMGEKAKNYTNVYVKNLPEDFDDAKLYEIFKPYGNITSHTVALNDDSTKSKGFGFVAFETNSEAEAAVAALNETELPGSNGKALFVGRAQKKNERQAELKKKYEAIKMERVSRTHGVNLYIKNLDDTIDDHHLREEFSKFGNITSAKVMLEDGRSRGFGFVCFNMPDEATRAVTEMNGRILGSKPLYVALAQRREDRKAQLASQYMDRITKMRIQNQQMYNAQNGYYMPIGAAAGGAAGRFYQPQAAIQLRPNNRWTQPGPAGLRGAQSFMQAGNSFRPGNPMGPRPNVVQQNAGVRQVMRAPQPNSQAVQMMMQQQQQQQQRLVASAPAMQVTPHYKYTTTARNQPAAVPVVAAVNAAGGAGSSALMVAGHEPLTSKMLADAAVPDQKQLLGERLYPLVYKVEPDQAGKITGMLLEMDNNDLLNMLDDQEALRKKMEEAMLVLQAHTAKIKE